MTSFQPQVRNYTSQSALSVRFGEVFRVRSKSGNETNAMTEAKLKADWEQSFAAAEVGFEDRFEREHDVDAATELEDDSANEPLLLTDVIPRSPELIDQEAELLTLFEKIKSRGLDAKDAQAKIDELLDAVLTEEEAMQETYDLLATDGKAELLAGTDYSDANVDDVNLFGVFKEIREKGAKAVKMLGDWYVLTKDDLVRYMLEDEAEQTGLKNLMELSPNADDSDVVITQELKGLKQRLAKKAVDIDVS